MALIRDDVQHTIDVHDARVPAASSLLDPQLASSTPADRGVFVELLDKHDQVLQRMRFETLPITLGSSYRCDCVLDTEEPSDTVVHVARNESGALYVEGDSKFWAPGGATLLWPVDPDRAFVVAGQRVRIRTRDYVPARRAATPDAIRRLSGWTVLFAVALVLATTAFQGWLIDIDQSRPAQYVTGAMVMFGALSIWAGIWALVSKLTSRSTHFLAHLSLVSLGSVLLTAAEFAVDSAAYAFDLRALAQFAYVIAAVGAGALVFAHARLIVRTRVSSAAIAGIAFAAAIVTIQATGYFNARSSLASSATLNEVRPPGWKLVDGMSIEQFQTEVGGLEAAVEALKAEKPEGADVGQYGE